MDDRIPTGIYDIMDRVMQDITNPIDQIHPEGQNMDLSEDVCMVQTTFEGGHQGSLTLCVDTALLTRLAKQVLEEETVAPEDLEDFAKEYFNVICGQIVARLFQLTKTVSRFHIPCVCTGLQKPNKGGVGCHVLNYTNNCHEGVRLIHQAKLADDTNKKTV